MEEHNSKRGVEIIAIEEGFLDLSEVGVIAAIVARWIADELAKK